MQIDSPGLEIKILSQGWLGPPDNWPWDLCSHGALRATIGGVVVTRESPDYGISQSALALLRTLSRDHTPQQPVISSGYLLGHGCGFPLWPCPNFGTDWSVNHRESGVQIGDIRDAGAPSHPEISVTLPFDDYRREVVAFARTAREFYFSADAKRFSDDWDREAYEQFWTEFDALLGEPGSS